MQYFLPLLALLACPVGMGLMMWLMMRGNKDQATYEANQMPMDTYSEPVEVTNESPQGASLLKTIGSCLKMCLNWKVVAGLAVVGLLVLVVAPQFIWAALPLLLVAACPLSMLFMMRGMQGGGSQSPTVTHSETVPELGSRLSRLQAEQEAIARQIAELEATGEPTPSEDETVTHVANKRDGSRSAPKR